MKSVKPQQKTFDCDDLRSHIFSFVGDPLPPDRPAGSGFNYQSYYIYTRQADGTIREHIGRKIMKCKNCKSLYSSTGYENCASCYEKWRREGIERRKFQKMLQSRCCLIDIDDD